MSLGLFFLLGQGLAGLPALPAGTTVMLVADDLLTIYASGVVQGAELIFDRPLVPGATMRLLVLSTGASSVQDSGSATIRVVVAPGGQDLLVEGQQSLAQWLSEHRQLHLVVPTE